MDNCTIDCIQLSGNFSYQETCRFVEDQCLQDSVQFIQGYYCVIHQSFILLVVIAVPYVSKKDYSFRTFVFGFKCTY